MAGVPDIDDFTATYGGAKSNYWPVEDPTTDEDAAVRNLYAMNVAYMTGMCPRAWVRFTGAATTGAMILVAHQSLWGNAVGVAPTLARTSAGLYTITWPTTVTDQLGTVHTLNFRGSWTNVRDLSATWNDNSNITSANVCTVQMRNQAGTATDTTGLDSDVWVF
jgi:hypothetical protein